MAFLSLGLDREEPSDVTEPKLQVLDKPKATGSADPTEEDAVTDRSAKSAPENNSESKKTFDLKPANTQSSHAATTPTQDPPNGNGSSAKTKSYKADAEPEETQSAAQDDWPEMGMQIIQSVLLKAQNQPPSSSNAPVRERNEVSPIKLLPEIEALQEKIAGSVSPDTGTTEAANQAKSSTTPASGETTTATTLPDLSSLMEELQAKIAGDTTQAPVSTVAPAALSSVMEDIERKLADEGNSLPESIAWEPRASTAPALTSIPSPTHRKHASTPTQTKTVVAHPDEDGTPTFATFKFGYLPGKGLLYSLIGHEVAMFGLFLLITYVIPSMREQRLIVGSLHAQDHVIYLPEVGGGTEGQKSPGGGESKAQQASAAPARASKGFAYPGAQAILSNPPNPTNAFQTVLHPLAVHPEPLRKLVPLPNIVQMAETRLPKDLVSLKAAMPKLQAPPPKAYRVKQDDNVRRNAKWEVPVKAPQLVAKADMPKLPAAEQPLPAAPKVEPKPEPKKPEEKTQDAPKPAPIKVSAEKRNQQQEKQVSPLSTAQVARLEMHGKSPEPLLSLSPVPLPSGANVKVPAGEARGRFAIAPGGKLNPNSITPGKPNGTPSESPATGQEKSQAANATTELASNNGTGAGHNAVAGGGSGNSKTALGGGSAGAGSGAGNTAGAGVGGNGTGNGHGNSGAGAGRAGSGAGTGAGAGSGTGSGSFPGITIQGGEGNEGTESHGFTVAPQTPYQMTIVATASSGGGLPDFGVFENERVYTVYIPMQRTPQEADPTWTLQYALEGPSADPGDGQLIAPTPVMREWPQIPAEIEKRYVQQEVVAYAVLGTDGKLTHISIKQTPDAQVSTPIAHALGKWVFRPAQMNNKPVPVKILIGIPL